MTDSYGRVAKPFWDDKPVAIVGGGPSMVDFDFERLRGCHVLAVKSVIFSIPWADAGFGLDVVRYAEWRERLADVQARIYWAVPEDQLQRVGAPPSKNITFVRRLDGQDVSKDPSEIYGGGTSGFGALQICIHKRAKKVVLFGFDYEGDFNPTQDVRRRAQVVENWKRWARHFDVYAPHLNRAGMSVVNACPASAIACFQKVTLDDGVEMLK